MLKAGDSAPDFALPDQDGRVITLAELIGRGGLILFFYPGDFTPLCTREACLFRDSHADIAAAGIQVAGISPDDSASHARFRVRHGLDYTLLADPDKKVIGEFGVDGPLGFGVRRATFLIDRERTIRLAVRADLRLAAHSKLLKSVLAEPAKGSRESD